MNEPTEEYEAPTWGKLRDFLNSLPPDDPKLSQQIEILPPRSSDETTLLMPVVTWGTVEELLHVDGEISQQVRSAANFTHQPEQLILTADWCPYDEKGNSCFTLLEMGDGSIGLQGDKTGEIEQI